MRAHDSTHSAVCMCLYSNWCEFVLSSCTFVSTPYNCRRRVYLGQTEGYPREWQDSDMRDKVIHACLSLL